MTKRMHLLCLCIASFFAPAAAQDWSWYALETPVNARYDAIAPAGDVVLHVGAQNVYRGPLFGTVTEVLAPGEFAYIEDRPQLLSIPGGSVLILGSSRGQTAFGAFHMRDMYATPERYAEGRFDGERYPTGFGSDVSVIDDSTLRLRNTYSFDTGKTWYYMRNDTVMTQRTFAHRIGDVVVAKNEVTGQWYVVDTTSRRYMPAATLDEGMCQYAVLSNGAAMAMRCIEGDETGLSFRTSRDGPWQDVPPLVTPEGTMVRPASVVTGRSQWLLTTSTNKAVFILDSGRVIEFDGSNVRVRSLVNGVISGELLTGASRPRYDIGQALLVYQVREQGSTSYAAVIYSLRDESTVVYRGLRHVPVTITPGGYLSRGPYHTDVVTGRTSPTVRVFDDNALPVGQPHLPQVVPCGTWPVAIAQSGEMFVADDEQRTPSLHALRTKGRNDAILGKTVLGRLSLLPMNDTSFLVPDWVPRIVGLEGLVRQMPRIQVPNTTDVTCAAIDRQRRVLVGGSFIARSNDTAWDVLPYPEQFSDAKVLVSSITTHAPSTIYAAARGHGVGSSTESSFQWRRGGIVVTTDDGITWETVPLPANEQWVEHLTTGPDGALYCWATTMVLDTDYGTEQNPMPRYGTARLYRSVDGGATWVTIFTDEADDEMRRQAVDHQWSISFAPNGAMAINTPDAVYVAPTPTSAFTAFDDLPFNARIGGCAFAADNTLWVVGSHGIHKRSLQTSSVLEEVSQNTALLVTPNPVTDQLVIRCKVSGHSSALPDHVLLTSIDGTMTQRIPLTGTVYQAETSDLPAGVYVASARFGSSVVSAKVVIVR